MGGTTTTAANASFTITENIGLVTLEWDATRGDPTFTVNSPGRPYFADRLSNYVHNGYYLVMPNCPNITGDLSDLQGTLTYGLSIVQAEKVTGDIIDMCGKLTGVFRVGGCPKITGSLADLNGKLSVELHISACTNISGVYTPANADGCPTTFVISNSGMSTSDCDSTLIAIAAVVAKVMAITATGMTRTAASDAAVATIVGLGGTVSGFTKVD